MKNEEKVLSREQMAHLKELGVDASDASMIWVVNKENPSIVSIDVNDPLPYVGNCACDFIPTYTIGDLIEKLPKSIDLGFGEYDLELSIKGEYVEVQYENDYDDYTPFFCANLSLIESLYSILCWLAENHKELL